MATDSCVMDGRSLKGSRPARKYQSGCACAVGLTEPVANGRLMEMRHDSVGKAVNPVGSDVRLASTADAGDERINREGEYSSSHRKDSKVKGQSRPRQATVTDLSCGTHRPKSRGSHGHGLGIGLGCRTIGELGDESFTKIAMRRTMRTKESAEAVVNQKFIDGKKSKQFMEALYILNSNKSLFVKLLEDPNSFLAKHIRGLRESGEDSRKSKTVSELKMGKDEGVGMLSPRKLKIWEMFLPRRSAEKDKSCQIVVLKPGLENKCDTVVLKPGLENKCDEGDQGPYIGWSGGWGNGIRTVRQSRLPFGNLRKISKTQMGVNHEHSGVKAMKLTVIPSYEGRELDRESFIRGLSREDQFKLSNAGLAEVDAVHDSSLKEPDDGPQLPRTFEESKNVAQIHSRMPHSPDLVGKKIDKLECAKIGGRFLQDCRDQMASSSSDISFSNSTEESETSASADDKPEEEHESPVSVLYKHVASPINAPPKPDRATSDMPRDKFVRAAESMKSILTSSLLNWDTILPNYNSPNQLLRETGSNLQESSIDVRLLHDYTSEVLGKVRQYRWCSYQQGLVVVDSDVACDVMTRVDCDLVLPRTQDSNTERIITRDVTMKMWPSLMQLGEETDEIVIELTGQIIEDVVDEIL